MLDPLYELIAKIILAIHAGLAPIFGTSSGWAWGLSIIILTVAMRLLLFPLFVKQIKSQRAMQLLGPQMKLLQEKYKGDREKLSQEQMKLYKDSGVNPLMGCLPLILQMPVFFALFHTLNGIKPDSAGHYQAHSGISAKLVESAANAKVLGAPIAASFTSSSSLLNDLHSSAGVVKVVAGVMIILMGASTFWTQRQMMARTGGSMPAQQKYILYVLPIFFIFFGIRFQIGVLLYWLTTNLWSMGQQHVVISRMKLYGDKPAVAAAGGTATGGAGAVKLGSGKKPPGGGLTTPDVSQVHVRRRPEQRRGKQNRGRS